MSSPRSAPISGSSRSRTLTSIGLSPKLVLEVMRKIDSIRSELGCAVLVVEQKVKQVLEIAETVMVMKLGNLVYAGTPAQIRQHADSIFLC